MKLYADMIIKLIDIVFKINKFVISLTLYIFITYIKTFSTYIHSYLNIIMFNTIIAMLVECTIIFLQVLKKASKSVRHRFFLDLSILLTWTGNFISLFLK